MIMLLILLGLLVAYFVVGWQFAKTDVHRIVEEATFESPGVHRLADSRTVATVLRRQDAKMRRDFQRAVLLWPFFLVEATSRRALEGAVRASQARLDLEIAKSEAEAREEQQALERAAKALQEPEVIQSAEEEDAEGLWPLGWEVPDPTPIAWTGPSGHTYMLPSGYWPRGEVEEIRGDDQVIARVTWEGGAEPIVTWEGGAEPIFIKTYPLKTCQSFHETWRERRARMKALEDPDE